MSPPAPPTGWFWIDNGAVDRIAEVGPLAATVYLVLAKHADEQRKCYPSIGTITRLCKSKKKSVRKALRVLAEAGLIHMGPGQRKSGSPTPYVYTLLPLQPRAQTDPRATLDPRAQTDPGVGPQRAPEQDPKNKTQKKRAKKATFDPLGIDLPYPSKRFLETWRDFCDHRTRIKAPLTQAAVTRFFTKFQKWGEPKSVEAMDATIESGKWVGVFEPKANGNGQTKPDDRPLVYAN